MELNELLDLLKLPKLGHQFSSEDELTHAIEDVDEIINQLEDYKQSLTKLKINNYSKDKLKELASQLFDKYTDATFIGCVRRTIREDDSGNCTFVDDDFFDGVLLDEDENEVEYDDLDSEILKQLIDLFVEVYPNASFKGDDNASYFRDNAWYGLNRNYECIDAGDVD